MNHLSFKINKLRQSKSLIAIISEKVGKFKNILYYYLRSGFSLSC